ncbi:sensor histidine kinase [Rhizobium leguminosarum]|nr:sensor histidine kinase [Rhizobium leguminosarum]
MHLASQEELEAVAAARSEIRTNSPYVYVTGCQQDDHAYITVRDEGIGIDADDLPKMFQRDIRARSSTGIAGTGIGLNLAQVAESLVRCKRMRAPYNPTMTVRL